MENELQIANNGNDPNHIAESMLAARLNVGRGSHANGSVYAPSEMDASSVAGEIPLLTYGQEVTYNCYEYFALSKDMIVFMIYMSDSDFFFFFYMVKDIGISADKHALIIPPLRGKRVHPMPFSDSMSCKLVK